MMEEVHQAASSRITRVLLLGPTGVGKTFIAEEIHRLSRSSPEKFAAPNCGNPSAEAQYLELFGGLMMNFRETRLGAFEQADGGTVFLDEVHALAPETQQALKACMSEIGGTRMSFTPMATARKVTVDVRIISATDRLSRNRVALGKLDSALLRRLRAMSSPFRNRRSASGTFPCSRFVSSMRLQQPTRMGRHCQPDGEGEESSDGSATGCENVVR
ncbi:MAG: sigma 54-interacting transcriptional regulator [Devosia sp.]|nr:sigma 54-interacting transcriptional regulator [Devosia sp.]